ncbi:hypothetical protein MTX78_16610 [Hymenobacter tibetensis]|uniref:DUF4397 domain-containing protein n=1 Tax=Hymenobacter tibetensis TaxID=497967 RepID=A0ABY4CW74_9BACT|nr:hypothetical protein [Hymenobacter tibetensis]UOG73734.1 hypothetical protein MTX78_16610 [Hymenobacter tibetensis]
MIQRYFPHPAVLLGLVGLLLVSCEKEIDSTYEVLDDNRFPTLLSNALPTLSTRYAPGETVPIELNFAAQEDPIREIRVFQRIEPAPDSAVVQTIEASQAAFSRRKNVDTLVVNYVLPAEVNKSRVRFSAVVVSQNGLTKTRSINFRLAEATPTVRINSATNVTSPPNGTLVRGDVVRYNLTLNANGINTYPERPAAPPAVTAILYKELDSLVVYRRVGTGMEERDKTLTRRLPATGTQTGAQTVVTVDAVLPTSMSGQSVVYRFEAKSRFLGTPNVRVGSATAAPLTYGMPTALAAPRTATLTYTGTTGGDLAAFDLTRFAAVPAAGQASSKDLAITSTASNAVRLQTLNPTTGTPPPTPTRFVRLTTDGAAAYANATLNSIRQTFLLAPTASQVTTLDNVVVGDVVIARVRGLDQYVIFTVTGVNRTSPTDVAVTLAVKAL